MLFDDQGRFWTVFSTYSKNNPLIISIPQTEEES